MIRRARQYGQGGGSMLIAISKIRINPGRREADPKHIAELAKSISEIGLLNPITIDREHTLIAGLHRLEATKQLGRTEIECTVSSLDGLQAELAEIDENFVRAELSTVDYSELLLRRKEIYEALHPETRATREGGPFRGNQHNEVNDKMSQTSKSFVQDTAEKLGLNRRTVERQIQVAKNLTPEAKQIIRASDAKLTKKDAMQLSRLAPAKQEEAASMLASGEIASMREFPAEPETAPNPQRASAPPWGATPEDRNSTEPPEETAVSPAAPAPCPPSRARDSALFREIVTELKDMNKDCSCTPRDFRAEIKGLADKFLRDIDWYCTPYYQAVYPALSADDISYLQERMDSICEAAHTLMNHVKGS